MGPLPCPPWFTLNGAHYFNLCSENPDWGVPDNTYGHQEANTGRAYAGCNMFGGPREFIEIKLSEPLKHATCYEVRFFVNLADESCGIDRIGAFFSHTALMFPIGLIPHVNGMMTYYSDTSKWMEIVGTYTAVGGEEFLTIGNFFQEEQTRQDPECSGSAFYYIDDVSVEETITNYVPLDLGGPFYSCTPVTLNPGIPNSAGTFVWSNNTYNPTLRVTQTGTYTVNIIMGNCIVIQGSAYVEILGSPPINLGQDTVLCLGETFTIALDSAAGQYQWNHGLSGHEVSITTPGTYAVTFNDGCDLTYDAIVVDFLDTPFFDLGPDTELCHSEEIYLDVDPNLGSFLWQDGSTESTMTVTGPGLYSLTVTNMCGSFTDFLLVEEINPPTVNLPPTVVLCPGETVVLNVGNTPGRIVWHNGTVDPTFSVNTPGVYSVTVTNDCGVASSSTTVTQIPPLLPPNLGPDIVACPGDPIVLTVPPQGGDTIQWYDPNLDTTFIDTIFTVTASGQYIVEVFNRCQRFSDTINILLQSDPPVLTMPEEIQICPGQAVTLDPGSQFDEYLWSDGSTDPQLIVSTPGVYSVTVTASCGSGSDTVVVTEGGLIPTVFLGADTSMCPGQTVLITPTFTHVDQWLWHDGSDQPFYSATTPGWVVVEVSNGCGNATDSLWVELLPDVPTFSLGSDTLICPGESVTLFIGIPDVSILWSDGSTGQQATISNSGAVIATISNLCGSSSDTLQIGLLPDVPALDLGADQRLCPGEVIMFNPGIPDVDYLWQDGSTNPVFQTTQGGTIILTISNSCGTSTDTVEVVESTEGPQLDLGPDIVVCEGEIVTVNAGISGVQYEWQDGSTGSSYVTNVSAVLILTVTNLCGTDTDTIEVTITGNPPITQLGADTLLCSGSTLVLNADNDPNTSSLWQDGSTGDQFLVTQTGVYILTETNECGSDADTILVTIEGMPPTPSLGADTTLCEGTTLTLTSNADSMTEVAWQNGSSSTSFLVTSSGTYILTETNRCGMNADTIVITYQALPPAIDLGPDLVLCPGETVLLTAPVTTDEIIWQDGSNSTEYLVDASGQYSLTISNFCGTTADEVDIQFDQNIIIFPPDKQLLYCPGDVIALDVTQNFPALYAWSDGATTPSINITGPGVYQVTVSANCDDGDHEFIVEPSTDCRPPSHAFYIPNVITPNDDNINDQFSIYPHSDIEIKSVEGSIFDRWGNLLYSSRNLPFTWDGTCKGEKVPPGVYVYMILLDYTTLGEEATTRLSGDITVFR